MKNRAKGVTERKRISLSEIVLIFSMNGKQNRKMRWGLGLVKIHKETIV